MNEIEQGECERSVRVTEQAVKVIKYNSGDVEIKVFDLPKEALENIAKITGKEIKHYTDTRWIVFAKARDGSTLTLFEA